LADERVILFVDRSLDDGPVTIWSGATVSCVPLTSNLKWAAAPGNVVLRAKTTGLPKDSVANVLQIVSIDRDMLIERAGKVRSQQLQLVFAGIDLVLRR
jgi:mRNA interferase MazF